MQIKRFKPVIFAILLLMLVTSVSQAGSNFVDIKMDKEKLKVRQVPILLNGKIIKSDSPSFLYVDRTLVSARLISENYGAKVAWDHPTSTATITHEGNTIKLTINSDIARVNGQVRKLDKYSIPKLVDFGNGEAKTMVPLTFLAEILGYETDWDYEARAAYLRKKTDHVAKKDEEEEEELKEEEAVSKVGSNQIKGLDLTTREGKEAILVDGSKASKRNILKLNNPKRLVVDILDSELMGTDYLERDYNIGNIKKLRLSQFTPDKNYSKDERIVRLVVEIEEDSSHDDVKLEADGGRLILIPQENIKNNIGYDINKNILSLKAGRETDFRLDYDSGSHKMVIQAPREDLKLPLGKKQVNNQLLIDYQVEEVGGDIRLTARFRRDISHKLLSPTRTRKLELEFTASGPIRKSDRVVILDPGHGGNDPGTTGVNKAQEKELVLDVSQRVRDRLEDRGYGRIVMTRDSDKTLVLQNRPVFANGEGGDIFISVHANSAGAASASGIETYVPRTPATVWKKEDGRRLAKLVQEELIKETGAINRGVKEANHVVTRNTDMPAILIELGFMSNPAEAGRMASDSYRDKLADAIVRAIERYFEAYN